jgi:hypothetical protein
MLKILEEYGGKVGNLIASRQLRIFAILALFSLPKHESFQSYGYVGRFVISWMYYVCYAVVALAVFEKVMESKDDDSLVELFKPKEAEAYMQITNIVHKESKNRDLKAHLMATWGVDDTVAVEIEKLVEHVMTDFIHVWFDLSKFDSSLRL